MSGSIRFFITMISLVLVTSACASISTPEPTSTLEPTATPELSTKILFIGNNIIYSYGGLDVQLERLVDSANPSVVISAEMVHRSTSALEVIWEVTNAREVIGEGNYDVVVLQGDIPETDVETFHDSVRKFNADIKETGADTVLFMAWPYDRLGWITIDEIAQAHQDIAAELGVDVAPVGLAFQRSMEERPELDVYTSDKEHPNILGTYLATNVVYATLFGKDPNGLSYLPSAYPGVTEEEAAFLQGIAWETVQEYQKQQ